MDDESQTTLRIRYPRGVYSTMDGYVFSDIGHARQWLTQAFVDPTEFSLEEVERGSLTRCRMCAGSGFHQSIKPTGRRLTVGEFLKEQVDG
jgi:hypothetical protein